MCDLPIADLSLTVPLTAATAFYEATMSLEHAPHRARRFRRKEACDYLSDEHGVRRSPRTLAKLAVLGGGPVMIYEGRFPTYTPAALDDYAKAILSAPVHNTAERRRVLATSNAA